MATTIRSRSRRLVVRGNHGNTITGSVFQYIRIKRIEIFKFQGSDFVDMPEYSDTSEDFDFEAGDRVIVRVRENGGTQGRLVGKFVASVKGFNPQPVGGDAAIFCPPWAENMYLMTTVVLRQSDAEFERVGDDEVVQI